MRQALALGETADKEGDKGRRLGDRARRQDHPAAGRNRMHSRRDPLIHAETDANSPTPARRSPPTTCRAARSTPRWSPARCGAGAMMNAKIGHWVLGGPLQGGRAGRYGRVLGRELPEVRRSRHRGQPTTGILPEDMPGACATATITSARKVIWSARGRCSGRSARQHRRPIATRRTAGRRLPLEAEASRDRPRSRNVGTQAATGNGNRSRSRRPFFRRFMTPHRRAALRLLREVARADPTSGSCGRAGRPPSVRAATSNTRPHAAQARRLRNAGG